MQLDSEQRADSPLAHLRGFFSGSKGEANMQLSSSLSVVARKGCLLGQTDRLPDLQSTACTPHQRGDLSNRRQSKAHGSIHLLRGLVAVSLPVMFPASFVFRRFRKCYSATILSMIGRGTLHETNGNITETFQCC